MQYLIATTSEVVHLIALRAVHSIPLQEVHLSRYWQFYPQHNIYYIAGGSLEQLQLLSAMLMSDFVRNQLLSITNCMNGGYPRWQSQYLRKLVMPDVNSIGEELSSRMLDAYKQSDLDGINAVMKDIVRQSRKRIVRAHQAGVQLSFGF